MFDKSNPIYILFNYFSIFNQIIIILISYLGIFWGLGLYILMIQKNKTVIHIIF